MPSSASPASTAAPAGVTLWDIDPAHSSAHFAVRHMMVANVRGEFARITGTVRLDSADVTRSSVEASIDTASINTGEPDRDAHLKSADFLDVQKYPTIEFRSTRVARAGIGELEITGDLTLHGVTRPVLLRVETDDSELKDPYGNVKRGATATTRISRKDFGLEWNVALEAGGFLVGDEVKITLDVELSARTE
ncbi:MAG TPA: YceI family protein [Gemmatimonadales bacterium]|nr:YceI family protein [Gemmatimonadales bacterium]